MREMIIYIERFMDELEIHQDIKRGHCYKIFLRRVHTFLSSEREQGHCHRCLPTFFDCYRITMRGQTNAFLDLLDMLKSYEENAAVLIDKHRDHYIHSLSISSSLALYLRKQPKLQDRIRQNSFDRYLLRQRIQHKA